MTMFIISTNHLVQHESWLDTVLATADDTAIQVYRYGLELDRNCISMSLVATHTVPLFRYKHCLFATASLSPMVYRKSHTKIHKERPATGYAHRLYIA